MNPDPGKDGERASVSATNITCERGGREVFTGLSFELKQGELMEVRGPNGSGKSTLLRLLAGLNSVSAGTLVSTGAVHFAGHAEALKPALSVTENLAFWAACQGGTAVDHALNAFGLTSLANDPTALLSQGQRKRLALARLLATPRPIWLLDEPTSGLDQANQSAFATLLSNHIARGGLAIVATHVGLGISPTHSLTLEGRT